MKVTLVGSGIRELVEPIFSSMTVNSVSLINQGMLGNFTTLTYELDIAEDCVISQRKKLMKEVCDEHSVLVGLYKHGDWMSIYIFKRSAFK